MNWSRLIAHIAILSLALAVFTAKSGLAEPVLYGADSVYRQHADLQLTPDQKRLRRQFRAASGYFGAMYVNPAGEYAFAAKNYHTMQTALQVAEGACKLFSARAPEQCTLYATWVPRGFSGTISSSDGLSAEAERFFTGQFARMQRKGGYGALAVSGMSALGWSSEQTSPEAARAAALAKCDSLMAKTLDSFGETGRAAVLKAGLDKCRVLTVVRSDR